MAPEHDPHVESAAAYCRDHGYTPTQLRGMEIPPFNIVMEGDFLEAVWARLRKRR